MFARVVAILAALCGVLMLGQGLSDYGVALWVLHFRQRASHPFSAEQADGLLQGAKTEATLAMACFVCAALFHWW